MTGWATRSGGSSLWREINSIYKRGRHYQRFSSEYGEDRHDVTDDRRAWCCHAGPASSVLTGNLVVLIYVRVVRPSTPLPWMPCPGPATPQAPARLDTHTMHAAARPLSALPAPTAACDHDP